jgi:hypothetical protein
MNIHVKRNEKWMTLLQLRKVNKLATVTNLLTPPPCLHTDSFPFFPNTFSTFQIRPDDPIQFGSLSFSRITHSTSKTIKNNPISAHNHQILYIVIPLCKWPLMSVHHCTSEWHHYKKPHAKSDLAVAGQLVIMATIQDSIGLWWMYIYLISSFRFYRVTKKDLVMRPF